MAVKSCLMVGGGGMAGSWIKRWTENVRGRIKIVGLVNVVPEILERQGRALGLDQNHLFTDANDALETVKADFFGIASLPRSTARSPSPGSNAVCRSSAKNRSPAPSTRPKRWSTPRKKPACLAPLFRTTAIIPTSRNSSASRIRAGWGLKHILGRYASDYRKYGSKGKSWRHDMGFGLLFESSVHHSDM